MKIDRIDARGNIREHDVSARDPKRTACGVRIGCSQPPCGNEPCKRCEMLAEHARRAEPRRPS